MEESTTTTKTKKPLSLNQRFSRFLSASHSKQLPRDDNQFKLTKFEDDAPPFTLVDFDFSPDVTELSREYQCPNLDSEVFVEAIDENNPIFSELSDVEPRLEIQSKLEKVKIEGRRRLCKVSSNNDVDNDVHQTNKENRHFLDVSDFSSPSPRKNVHCGENEIRDILNNLSSRLESLTIEKKKNPKPVVLKVVPLNDDLLQKVKEKGIGQADDLVDSEFGSVDSSFATTSSLSSSSSGVKDGIENKEAENALFIESDGDNFDEIKMYKDTVKGKSRNVSLKAKEDLVVSRRETVYNIKDDSDAAIDDDDDCVEVAGSHWSQRIKRHYGKLDREYGDSSVVEVLVNDGGETNKTASQDDHIITLIGPSSTYKLPAEVGKMLYPHQRDGLRWLWSLHCQGKGGILGDDMGLGKTMQISGFLAGLFSSHLTKRVMIVAPKTLIPHWIQELSAVGLSQMIKEYCGTCPKLRNYELQDVFQDKGILLTTYDIVRFNAKQLTGSNLYYDDCDDGPLWDYMILDEGHLIKNPSTQRAKSLLGIPCAHRIIISGTPIQNNLKELWALFYFCCPELLGDHKEFREKYEHPILRGNDKRASERDKRVGSMVAKVLRERIQPYFLRRLKNEVFGGNASGENTELSKKNEIIVWLRLTSCQRQLYEAFLKSEIVLSAFDGSPLAALTILKKICDHPYLLTKRAAEDVLEGMDSMLNNEERGLAEKLAMHASNLTEEDEFQEKHDNLSCKISFIMSLLEKLIPEGHNVLIFSQTRKMLNLIQKSLTMNGFSYLRIDGTTKACDRLKIVNEFQEGRGAPIFLLTSQVGGLGLTLTKADRVIVVDPAWNPSTDNQSVDRAYRIGQKKDVIVYRLMTCGTIEEKIYRKQIFKGGLFKTATEHKEQTRYFSHQDLQELFSLPKDGFDVSPTQLQLHAEHGDQISMSDFLKVHINFLESLGIGGVSHHSLLYTKTEPTPVAIEEIEPRRTKNQVYTKFGSSSTEHFINGSQHAFNPKDVNLHKINPSPQSATNISGSDIKERINILYQHLSNKATISRLPDRGEKIRKRIIELNLELENLTTNEGANQVIELDDY
ncbi:unnamed protein product [Amaranthus hypochondriacus]